MEAFEPEIMDDKSLEKVEKANKLAIVHNQLIEKRNKFTLDEIRLMDTLISFIQPEDKELKDYKIPVSIFQELMGSNRKDTYDIVRKAVRGLRNKGIEIETINKKGKKVWETFSFISYGMYIEGEGSFIVRISREFKPYLLQLKEFFTKVPIKYTYRMSSKYSVLLYELLKQYENFGRRKDSIDKLRTILGIEPNEYKRFYDFEKWVIKTAVKEINEKTDIEVSYIKKKTGRKITHIEFQIRQKNKSKNEKIGDTTETAKTPSQSVDTQGQKNRKNFNPEDLWKGVLKILEYNYGAHPADIDFIGANTFPEYHAKTTPKLMVIKIEDTKDKKLVKNVLEEYKKQIDEIVNIETGGSYIAVIE